MSSNLFLNCEGRALISRRNFLKATAILSFAGLPELTLAQSPSDTRLLTILLRGGLDGMFAVPPIGDKGLSGLRPHINPDKVNKLDGFFGLHPAFKNVFGMYQKGEALIVHGTSVPYTGRSHFEGQDIMETGVMVPYASKSGWMGRALDLQGYESLTLSLPAPLILRGKLRPDNYFPSWLERPPKRIYDKVLPLWAADASFAEPATLTQHDLDYPPTPGMPAVGKKNPLTLLAAEAGRRLKAGDGPRMAVLDHVGFDTHANEPKDNDRLMAEVDDAIGHFRTQIGDDIWKKTLVVTVTEFGRTAAENGSLGTDHGWGTAILVMGGKLKKGGVVADWAGLKSKGLFEGRDLMATIDARQIYGAIMTNVLELDPRLVKKSVFDYEPSNMFDAYL